MLIFITAYYYPTPSADDPVALLECKNCMPEGGTYVFYFYFVWLCFQPIFLGNFIAKTTTKGECAASVMILTIGMETLAA